jgi:hypothetical protein
LSSEEGGLHAQEDSKNQEIQTEENKEDRTQTGQEIRPKTGQEKSGKKESGPENGQTGPETGGNEIGHGR